jgi:uncharacterized protein YodC (DUF2158 family)
MQSDVTDAFKPGDLVQLKSGGPIMTVDDISKLGYGVAAIWYAYGKRRRHRFPALSPQRAAARQARPFGTRPGASAVT